MSSPIPPLETCKPEEVGKYLLDHRFKGNATEAATFLLQAIDNLPNIEEISNALVEENDDDEGKHDAVPTLLGSKIESMPQGIASSLKVDENCDESISISAIVPRSKFKIDFYENGCKMTNAKDEELIIPSNHVKHLVMFPKREDCLKVPKNNRNKNSIGEDEFTIPGTLVLIILDQDAVQFRQKSLTQICFQLPQHKSNSLDSADKYDACWVKLFKSSFDLNEIVRVYNPKIHKDIKGFNFQSDEGDANTSIMQGGMPYVKCYSGVNDGVLYPIEEGLLFFKPPQFIHRNSLHSISCGRGSGGSSRFVDLVVDLDDESKEGENKQTHDFTNIDREELQCLNNYIHNVLIKAMEKDINDGDEEENNSNNKGTDDDAVSVETRKRKPQRSASMYARKATKVQLQTNASEDEGDEEDDDFADADGDDEDDNEDDDSFEEEESDEESQVELGTDTESEADE